MNRWKPLFTFAMYLLLIMVLTEFLYLANQESQHHDTTYQLITKPLGYSDQNLNTTSEKLIHRINQQPFNIPALIIFVLAIFHTLFAHKFTTLSDNRRQRNLEKKKKIVDDFGVEILNFLGEVEVIFGIWVIPLCLVMTYYYDWWTAIHYLNTLDYKEPLFVVVVMTIASTTPIIKLTEDCLRYIAQIGGGTVKAWWWTILTIGPLAGSFVTEPGAMTISAIMLSHHFYKYKPSPKFAYATLGLLFVNISVGGVLTSFAAPPVLMVSAPWDWSTEFMMMNFGWKAGMGILCANTLYYLVFKNDLNKLDTTRIEHLKEEKEEEEHDKKIPFWITIMNLTFLAWIVVHNHYPVIFIGSFMLFLGFQRATLFYQPNLNLRLPTLVGFFLAGLIVHGNLQGWWISPILGSASENILMLMSASLTAFTDNAEITFLASLIPTLTDPMKYAIVAGAISGGGLTVIANAPNPLGQALLGKHFQSGISAGSLFIGAIIPTIIMAACFWIFKPF